VNAENNPVFVRIDDRLIHGQVVEGWLPYLKPDAVLVVSDAAAGDPMQETLMSIALPAAFDLYIATAAAAPARVLALAAEGRRVLALAPGPREALALLRGGVAVRSINVGGLHHSAGRVQVGKAVFLSPEDKEALRAITELGVALDGRSVPGERPADFAEILR